MLYYAFRFGLKIGDNKTVTTSADTDGDGIPDAFVNVETNNFVSAMANAFENDNDEGASANDYLQRLKQMNDDSLKSFIVIWKQKYEGKGGTFGYFAWKPLSNQISSLFCRDDWLGNKKLDCQLRDEVANRVANLAQQI